MLLRTLFLCFLVVSCKKGGGGGNENHDPVQAQGTVGAGGGEITSPDNKIKLTIPAGALAADTALSIVEKSVGEVPATFSGIRSSYYYDLQPEGVTFAQPVTISATVPATITDDGDNSSRGLSFLVTAENDAPSGLANQGYEEASEQVTLTGETLHFSPLIVTTGSNNEKSDFIAAVNAPAKLTQGVATDFSVTASHEPAFAAEAIKFGIFKEGLQNLSIDGDLALEQARSFGEETSISVTGTLTCQEPGTFVLAVLLRLDQAKLTLSGGANFTWNNFMKVYKTGECVAPSTDDTPSTTLYTVGLFPTVTKPEGAFELFSDIFAGNTFAESETKGALVVAGKGGKVVHDPATGAIIKDLTNTEDTSQNYGGFAGPKAAFTFGSGGTYNHAFDQNDWAFGSLKYFQSNITDGYPIYAVGHKAVTGALVADNTLNKVYRYDLADNGFGYMPRTDPIIDATKFSEAGLTTNVVSVYSPEGEGAFLGVTDSGANPGKLFHASTSNGAPVLTVVGDVGQGPRRLRCLDDGGTPCVVTNYSSGTLSIIDWPTRTSAPTIRNATIAVSGPVGVDVKKVGDSTLALATGFNDNTLHIVKITAESATDNKVTFTDCAGPGHAVFLGDGSYIAVTCNTDGKLKVIKTP